MSVVARKGGEPAVEQNRGNVVHSESPAGGALCSGAGQGTSPIDVRGSVEGTGVRAWVGPLVRLDAVAPPDGDPDRLLAATGCRMVKNQRKMTVGAVTVPRRYVEQQVGTEKFSSRTVFVKRYNAFSWRPRLASLFERSPAERSWLATGLLKGAGFLVPSPVAAVEYRRWGMLRKSFFLTVGVCDAVPADSCWWNLQRASLLARRAFVRGLAELFAALHAAGIYHSDLKDANILVRSIGEDRFEYYLLDLERVRRLPAVARRRRVKNLVQLHRTLGRLAGLRENLYFLRVYLGEEGRRPATRRLWRRAVCRAVRAKDMRHALRSFRSARR